MSEHAYVPGWSPRGRSIGRTALPDSRGALGFAGLCLLGLVATWAVADLVPGAQVKDAVALHDFTLLDTPHIDAMSNFLLNLLDPVLFTIWGLALVLFAIAAARPRVALAVALVMGGAPLSAELLKPLLAHPHVRIGVTQVGPASWPSGHATAAVALALCAVIVAPAHRRRTVLALGAAFSLAIGCALLIRAWHMPSDVVGGYLLGALWAALAVAGLRVSERRWPPSVSAFAGDPAPAGSVPGGATSGPAGAASGPAGAESGPGGATSDARAPSRGRAHPAPTATQRPTVLRSGHSQRG